MQHLSGPKKNQKNTGVYIFLFEDKNKGRKEKEKKNGEIFRGNFHFNWGKNII